jgi:hypothetical protein
MHVHELFEILALGLLIQIQVICYDDFKTSVVDPDPVDP